MSARFFLTGTLLFLFAINASAARYQRTKDGKTLVWNNLRGVAQEATWSGSRDAEGYATGEGTLTWYRLGNEVTNSYTGKMVRGKFEGPVIREQGQTRLQATFANGEQTSGWSEPGRIARAATTPKAAKNEESPSVPESGSPESEESVESASPSATPTPVARSTPRPTPAPTPRLTSTPASTFTPRSIVGPTRTPTEPTVAIPTTAPSRTPVSTATPTAKPVLAITPRSSLSPTATARTTATEIPIPNESLTPPLLKSMSTATPVVTPPPSTAALTAKQTAIPRVTATATVRSTPKATPFVAASFAPQPESVFDLSNRSSTAPKGVNAGQLPQASNLKPTPTVPIVLPNPSAAKNPEVKKRMVADFKQRTAAILGQMKEATGNFKPVEQLDQVQNLPSTVSANVTYLALYAQQFKASAGYETTYYECLDQVETVDALSLAEEATRDLANKDGPAARKSLERYVQTMTEPPTEDRKALARYLKSIFAVCDKAKTQAEPHLHRARDLEAAGKKSEALTEYREIYGIYPNPLIAAKIKELDTSH